MQVFNAFIKVLKKKLPASLIYITVFLVISIQMAKSGSAVNTFEATSLNVCIFDEDNTEESRALSEFIGTNHKLVELENDRDTIMDALYYERVDYVLIINQGYAERIAADDTDDLFSSYHMHYSYGTVFMEQLLNKYVGAVKAYRAGGKDISGAIESTESALVQETKVTYVSFDNDNGNTDYSIDFSFYFQYMPYILLSVLMSTLCPVLLIMNRKDIRFRTNCSSVKPNSYTMQIFAGSTLFIVAVWLVFMVAGMFMYGGIYQGKAWLAVLNSFIFALVSAAIAVFNSSFDPSQNIISLMTQILGLGMSFLCGIFVQQSMLGDGVLAVARFLPAYWYVRANDMLAGREIFDALQLAGFLAIEAAFAVVLMLLTLLVRRLKYSRTGFIKVLSR